MDLAETDLTPGKRRPVLIGALGSVSDERLQRVRKTLAAWMLGEA